MSDQHLARKRFGQNFLSDPNIIRKIIEAIRPLPGDRMVGQPPQQLPHPPPRKNPTPTRPAPRPT